MSVDSNLQRFISLSLRYHLEMASVRGNALIGPNLKFVKDVLIEIDDSGIITNISNEHKSVDYLLPPSFVLIPGFVNAHTHVADAFLKDHAYGKTIEETVGPDGIKHSKLSSSSKSEKAASMKNSLELLVKNGYTTFIDFREEGKQGVQTLREELNNFPIRGIILGRNVGDEKLSEIIDLSDGLGFCDVFSISDESMEETRILKKKNPSKLIAIHAAETMELISESLTRYNKPDVEKICEYPFFDFVVHATYSNENDLSLLRKHNIEVVCCPVSNLYHGLKFPPIALILKNEILLGLGTDNVLSCNPDSFRLMAFTLYSARSNCQNIQPKEILKAITVNPGKIINRKIGQISEGYSGDLLGINLENPNTKYSKDVFTAITMRAESSDIGFQMFEGKVVKWKDPK